MEGGRIPGGDKMSQAFEMQDVHRQLLAQHKSFLLHNLRPTELFWSALVSRDILSSDMIDDIKASRTISEQISRMLDLLPARGPGAFEQFCETLLECDHAHVAEFLKMQESTDLFRRELAGHSYNISDHQLDRMVNIYKHNTPQIKRFAEQKYQIILDEQDIDIRQKEEELKQVQNKNTMLHLEMTQLRSFITTCSEVGEDIAREVENEFISKTFLREEKKHIGNLKNQLEGIHGFENACEFYDNMQILLNFLERQCTSNNKNVAKQTPGTTPRNGLPSIAQRPGSATGRRRSPLQDKIDAVTNAIMDAVEMTQKRAHIQSVLVKCELDKVLNRFKDLLDDVFRVRDMFKNSHKQKRKLETEALSFVVSYQEMRRLQREAKEKQAHISELNRQSLIFKKKSRQHKTQLEHIQQSIDTKRFQVREIQMNVDDLVISTDETLQSVLKLLPDLEDVPRCNTVLTIDTASTSSRQGSAVSGYRPRTHLIGDSAITKLKKTEAENSNETDQSEDTEDTSESSNNGKTNEAKEPKIEMSTGTNTEEKQVVSGKNNANSGPVQSNNKPQVPRLLDRRQQHQSLKNTRTSTMRTSLNSSNSSMRGYLKATYTSRQPNQQIPHSTQRSRTQSQSQTKSQDTVVPVTPTVSSKPKEFDMIDKWMAQQKNQTKSEEIQQKVSDFKLIEFKDRTEEIKKLGKCLLEEKVEQLNSEHAAPAESQSQNLKDIAEEPEGNELQPPQEKVTMSKDTNSAKMTVKMDIVPQREENNNNEKIALPKTSGSTHSGSGSGTASSSSSRTLIITGVQHVDPGISPQLSSRTIEGQSPSHNSLRQNSSSSDEKVENTGRLSEMKRSSKATIDTEALSTMGSSLMRRTHSTMARESNIAEMIAMQNAKKKAMQDSSRGALKTNKIELRLPSK